MDFASHRDAKPCRPVANTTQLHNISVRTGNQRRETRGFFNRSLAFSKGINVSRTAASSLGVAMALAFGTSARAADLIGQAQLQVPPQSQFPLIGTEPTSAATSVTPRDGPTGLQVRLEVSVRSAEPISSTVLTCLKVPAASLVGFRAVTTSCCRREPCSALKPMPRSPI